MFGFTGKILYLDLTTTIRSTKDLDESISRHYLGASGLGARILSSMDWEVDPLAPENRLVFMTGPLLWQTIALPAILR